MDTAVLDLFINDNGDGVLCTAVADGTDSSAMENILAQACIAVPLDMPDDKFDELEEQVQKQSVRSVLGQLSKLGYKRVIVGKNSDVPDWMPSMLKNWKDADAAMHE